MNQNAIVPAGDSRLSFGQTALRPQDFIPPRVKVVQQMSKEAADGLAAAGDLFNTLTGENLGTSIKVQPILPFMQRILIVRREKRDPIVAALKAVKLTLAEGDGLLCRSNDMIQGRGSPGIACDDCPLSQWDEATRRPPLCTETYNVAAMDEIGGLVILSFQKSSAKVGKRFFSTIRMRSATAHPWASIFEISTRQERNDLGTFYVPDFRVSPDKPDTAMLAGALAWAQQLQGVVINVTPEDEGGYDSGGEAGSDEAPF
jgi:hypothetical protein